MPFSELVSVTVAEGTKAPDGSATTPERVAVVVAICALPRGAAPARMAYKTTSPLQYQRDLVGHFNSQFAFVFNVKPPVMCSLSVQDSDNVAQAPESFVIGHYLQLPILPELAEQFRDSGQRVKLE